MDSSAQLKVLLKFHEELRVIIRNNLEEIARHLHLKEVINREKYCEVTDSNSSVTGDERARKLLRRLEDKVQENVHYYSIFCNYLSLKERYSTITAQMNEEIAFLTRRKLSEWV